MNGGGEELWTFRTVPSKKTPGGAGTQSKSQPRTGHTREPDHTVQECLRHFDLTTFPHTQDVTDLGVRPAVNAIRAQGASASWSAQKSFLFGDYTWSSRWYRWHTRTCTFWP